MNFAINADKCISSFDLQNNIDFNLRNKIKEKFMYFWITDSLTISNPFFGKWSIVEVIKCSIRSAMETICILMICSSTRKNVFLSRLIEMLSFNVKNIPVIAIRSNLCLKTSLKMHFNPWYSINSNQLMFYVIKNSCRSGLENALYFG